MSSPKTHDSSTGTQKCFPLFWIPLEAARDIASRIPVVEGGPAERGEPYELVPGTGELEAIPEHCRREGSPLIRG
jgi:hypothetical protein